jgi:hypothetical protein
LAWRAGSFGALNERGQKCPARDGAFYAVVTNALLLRA